MTEIKKEDPKQLPHEAAELPGNRFTAVFVLVITALIITFVIYILPYPMPSVNKKKAVKLTYVDHISAAHLQIIEDFNRQYKGKIEVVAVNLPFSKFTTNERKELIARSLRSHSSRIDIFTVDLIWVPRFAKWAEPLDHWIDPVHAGKIMSQALQSCYHNNILVGLPQYLDVGAMFYRRDLLEKIPDSDELIKRLRQGISWDEFLALKTHFPDSYLYNYQGKAYEGLMCNYVEIVHGMGGYLQDGQNLDLHHPIQEKALQFLRRLISDGYAPQELIDFDENRSYEFALQHDIPFFRGWPSFPEDFLKDPRFASKVGYLELAPLPHFEAKTSTSVFGGWNLMINRDCQNKAEAVTFLKYITDLPAQQTLFAKGRYLPVNRAFYERGGIFLDRRHADVLLKMLQNGSYRPVLEDYTKNSDIISFFLNRALKGDIEAGKALKDADTFINSGQVIPYQ
jgi:multiple sugar transport system substrate-binding protein